MRIGLLFFFLITFRFSGLCQCSIDWNDLSIGMSYVSMTYSGSCNAAVVISGAKSGSSIDGQKSVCIAKADTSFIAVSNISADSVSFLWAQAYSATVDATVYINSVLVDSLKSEAAETDYQFRYASPSGTVISSIEIRQNSQQAGQINIGSIQLYSDSYLSASTRFTYGDVILSEFLADPSPAVYLPECEFLEFYNVTADSIDLRDLTLVVGDKTVSLPRFSVAPFSPIVIHDGCYDEVSGFLQLDDFPTLSNEAFQLSLYGNESLVFSYDYNHDNYKGIKDDGGWSLERSGVGANCPFQYSENSNGGTPAVFQQVGPCADTDLQIEFAQPISERLVNVQFSGIVDSSRFALDNIVLPIGQAISLQWNAPSYTSCVIECSQDLPIAGLFSVCVNNYATFGYEESFSNCITTGFSSLPQSGEVFISEVLFDVDDDVSEFVEIQNVSDNIVDLSDICIVRIDEFGAMEGACSGMGPRLLLPDSVVALARDKTGLSALYDCVCDGAIVETQTLPSLPNDGSTIAIVTRGLEIIDSVTYSPAMHTYGLDDQKNVSLVRGTQADRFYSSSSACNYASPGCWVNNEVDTSNTGEFLMVDPYFSPNADGEKDQLQISVFMKAGETVDISVFTETGRLCKSIAKTVIGEGVLVFQWDGRQSNGSLASAGIYVVLATSFVDGKKVHAEKATTVLLR